MATDILSKKSWTDIYDMAAMEQLAKVVNGVFVIDPHDVPYVTTDNIHQVVKVKCSGWDLWIRGKSAMTTIEMNDMPYESAVQFLECRQ